MSSCFVVSYCRSKLFLVITIIISCIRFISSEQHIYLPTNLYYFQVNSIVTSNIVYWIFIGPSKETFSIVPRPALHKTFFPEEPVYEPVLSNIEVFTSKFNSSKLSKTIKSISKNYKKEYNLELLATLKLALEPTTPSVFIRNESKNGSFNYIFSIGVRDRHLLITIKTVLTDSEKLQLEAINPIEMAWNCNPFRRIFNTFERFEWSDEETKLIAAEAFTDWKRLDEEYNKNDRNSYEEQEHSVLGSDGSSGARSQEDIVEHTKRDKSGLYNNGETEEENVVDGDVSSYHKASEVNQNIRWYKCWEFWLLVSGTLGIAVGISILLKRKKSNKKVRPGYAKEKREEINSK